MELNLVKMQDSAYENFIESIRSPQTRRNYTRDIQVFLKLIPNSVFEENKIKHKKIFQLEDKCEAFVKLAKKDTNIIKTMIKSYLVEIKRKVDAGEMSPNSVSNRIKPIKALLSANEVDISWKIINKMFPREIKSQDRAYTKKEIKDMLEHCTDIIDRLTILMFSSGGFRLEAWDYFCWKDAVPIGNDKEIKGAALRVYRGDPEEYWTFITPEAYKVLLIYKEEWKTRFLRYPKPDDPLIASSRFDVPRRLRQKGVRARIDKIVTKIGLRSEKITGTRRYEVKLDHGFRKYFNTMMRRAKVNYLDKEDMMGHKVGLERHYERYSEEDFERFPEYQKAIPFLTISDEERQRIELEKERQEKSELQKKVDEIEKLKELRKQDKDDLESFKEEMMDKISQRILKAMSGKTSKFNKIN